ncbi:MAG: CBS domain-containing protein [Tissierellia bacterium]|nr:CBS domain-containing protein [Tissierellia bacterium]
MVNLTDRQEQIISIVKKRDFITGEDISSILKTKRSAIRSDLTLLTMIEILGVESNKGYFYQGLDKRILLAESIKSYKVKDIMSLPIVISEHLSIYDAIATLFLENVGTIYVLRDELLCGVVSRKDLLKCTLDGLDLQNTPVKDIMLRMPNIKYVFSDMTVYECAKEIVDSQIDSLPVVKETKFKNKFKVIGRITKTNITKLFVEFGSEIDYREI